MFKSKNKDEHHLLSTLPYFDNGSKKNKQISFSILAHQTYMRGQMSFESEARIAGHFEGNLTSKDVLYIEETAFIKGEIHGVVVHISGSVEGSIYASDTLRLAASAKVEGEVKAGKLVVCEGAQLRSQVTSLDMAKAYELKALNEEEVLLQN